MRPPQYIRAAALLDDVEPASCPVLVTDATMSGCTLLVEGEGRLAATRNAINCGNDAYELQWLRQAEPQTELVSYTTTLAANIPP